MRKSTVLTVTTVGIALFLTTGCCHMSGPSDLELIQEMLAAWTDASKAQDIEKIMSVMSDDFSHEGYDYDAEDKATMAQFVEDSIAGGNYDGLEVIYNVEDITIEGDAAEVSPIEWSCAPGTACIGLKLKKEKAGWRIIDATVEEM